MKARKRKEKEAEALVHDLIEGVHLETEQRAGSRSLLKSGGKSTTRQDKIERDLIRDRVIYTIKNQMRTGERISYR